MKKHVLLILLVFLVTLLSVSALADPRYDDEPDCITLISTLQ